MTLLERWDRGLVYVGFDDGINAQEIRRAIAVAQAVDELDHGERAMLDPWGKIKSRADELLREKP